MATPIDPRTLMPYPVDFSDRQSLKEAVAEQFGSRITKEVAMQVAEAMKMPQTLQPVSELRERCVMAVLRQTCTSYEINAEATIKAADSLAQYILNGAEKE